ncbi:hypothetical protein NKH77_53595 [Streptomyces sp. M19]
MEHPTAEVRREGEVLGRLPGVFNDGAIRTYTGDPGGRVPDTAEEGGGTGAGGQHRPAGVRRRPDPLGAEAAERLNTAGQLLAGVHRLNLDFPGFPHTSS